MLKTILINPYPYYATGVEGVVYPPMGLLYLSAVAKVKKLGDVKVIDANILQMCNDTVVSEIEKYNPDIIGVSSNIVTHRAAIELIRLIKETGMDKFLLAGGAYPALFPDKYLRCCDIVVNGEGEETFCEILESFSNNRDIFSVEGVTYKKDGSIIKNRPREFLKELDTIPFPDYNSLNPDIAYYSEHARVVGTRMAPILTSRGCPYQCTYCNKSVFGSGFRYRGPDNILAEIEWLHKEYKIDQIDILDDNFNLLIDRASIVLDRIVEMPFKIAISCHNGLRADKITEGFVKKLKKAGVFKVGLGIETANPGLLKSIKKNLDLATVKKAISLLRKEGITVHGYFILGLPGDTPQTMRRTIDFAKEANPHFCNFATCIPFPGTAVYDIVKREGKFLTEIDDGVTSGFFDGKVFFEIDGTKEADVKVYYKLAYKEFYFNIRKTIDILFSIKSIKELIWLISTSLALFFNVLQPKREKYAD